VRISGKNSKSPRHTNGGEHGAAAVEFVLIAPVVLLVFLLLVQWAVRLEAERAVQAAAREGAVATARWDGTETTGRQTALDYLARLDPHLSNRSAQATREVDNAEVTVEGDVLSLIPFVDLRVHATAVTPVERFVP